MSRAIQIICFVITLALFSSGAVLRDHIIFPEPVDPSGCLDIRGNQSTVMELNQPTFQRGLFESDTEVMVFEESTSLLLDSDLEVDFATQYLDPMVTSDFSLPINGFILAPGGTIPAGTLVNSHLVVFDPVSSYDPAQGLTGVDVDFGEDTIILGLVYKSDRVGSRFISSNAVVGKPGVDYSNFGVFGDGLEFNDRLLIEASAPGVIHFDFSSSKFYFDAVRVITYCIPPPEVCPTVSGSPIITGRFVDGTVVARGVTQSDTDVYVIEERVDYQLPVDLDVDIRVSGNLTHDGFVRAPGFTIPSGTIVNSHLVFFDPLSSLFPPLELSDVEIDFGTDARIVGLVYKATKDGSRFFTTSTIVGAPTLDYSLLGRFGDGIESNDIILITDDKPGMMTISFASGKAYMDAIRVITVCDG